MSAEKEIRSKIKSVQNTQKITKAMQMVATSKMRKTQEKMRSARPYANNIRRIMANVAKVSGRSSSLLLREVAQHKNIGIVVIGTDKGLCGGLNANTAKLLYQKVTEFTQQGIQVELCVLGQKALNAANKAGLEIVSSTIGLGDIPSQLKLLGPLSILLTKFKQQELDGIYVIYSQFINTMKQNAVCEQLLPLSSSALEVTSEYAWDYIYEPSAEALLDDLVQRYIEAVVYQFLADNMASEQAARMVAMKAATDNANTAINKLRLSYNKSRQAAITKELAEIVSGASAV